MELKKYFQKNRQIINKALKRYLPKDNSLLSKAMRYSVFAGGKRLRPTLLINAVELCGKKANDYLAAACSVEFIHTYSLIHDDLPAMDNDDLRRGMPTSHKKFGEATAILAGDALLTDAFRILSGSAKNKKIKLDNIIDSIEILSKASGYKGMIGGQMRDTVEQNSWQKESITKAKKNLNYIHLNKTAALIRACLVIGVKLANAPNKQVKALDLYGRNIGLAFQITDDILDITADKKLLGKRGSDRDNKKLTYPAIYGIEKSKKLAEKLISDAKKSIAIFGRKKEILCLLADYIVNRNY